MAASPQPGNEMQVSAKSPSCGTGNFDSGASRISGGSSDGGGLKRAGVDSHLGKAIAATFILGTPLALGSASSLLGMPAGWLAMYYSLRVDNRAASGDMEGAVKDSRKANFLAGIGICGGLIVLALRLHSYF